MDLLDTYSGANNYILYIKDKKNSNKKFYPTRSQSEYITTYFDIKPKVARKWVDLDTYFAKKFAEERYLLKTPEKVYIEKPTLPALLIHLYKKCQLNIHWIQDMFCVPDI